jgi:hypothetical protein
MYKLLSLPLLCSIATVPTYGAELERIARAAKALEPRVHWQERSVVRADLTCDSRQDFAILGTQGSLLVVAVFANRRTTKPIVIELESGLDANQAKLSVESQDFDPEAEDSGDVGPLPGFKRSKACYGLRLDDERIDSVHIYWNRLDGRFQSWQR